MVQYIVIGQLQPLLDPIYVHMLLDPIYVHLLLDPICTYIMEYISCPIYRCRSAAAISSNPALIAFACQCSLPVLLAPVLDPVACTSVHSVAAVCSVQSCLHQCWILCTEHCAQCCTVFQQCAVCTLYSIAGVCTCTLQWCLSALLAAVSTLAHCWILCTLLIVSVGACTRAMSCRISSYQYIS